MDIPQESDKERENACVIQEVRLKNRQAFVPRMWTKEAFCSTSSYSKLVNILPATLTDGTQQ